MNGMGSFIEIAEGLRMPQNVSHFLHIHVPKYQTKLLRGLSKIRKRGTMKWWNVPHLWVTVT